MCLLYKPAAFPLEATEQIKQEATEGANEDVGSRCDLHRGGPASDPPAPRPSSHHLKLYLDAQ